MKIILTGSTGFVGRHLARALLERGDKVYAIIRPQTDLSRLVDGVVPELYESCVDQLSSIVARIKPAVVFHLAARFQDRHAPADIDPLIRDNVTFGTMLAEAMTRADVRCLVNTGTSWQHYRNASYSPTCLYAATKQALEAILGYYGDAMGIKVVTLKLFDTYGPGDQRGKLLSRFVQMVKDGSSLDMSPGEQLIDLVHVRDVVDAFLKAAYRLTSGQVATSESYAVSSGSLLKLRELAAIFADCAGTPLRINWGARAYREREVMSPWSAGKLVPGWRPRISLRDGLKELIADHV